MEWTDKHGIQLEFTQPGNPQQNAWVEHYNRTVRYSWLSQHLFDTMWKVQNYATRRLWFYNHGRLNKANGGLQPKQMLAAAWPLLLASVKNGVMTIPTPLKKCKLTLHRTTYSQIFDIINIT